MHLIRISFALALVTALSLACGAPAAAGAKTKGGGEKGSAAKDAGQKTGGTASGKTDQATNSGADVDGITCDDSLEGVAWCESDTEIIFCTGGSWYLLDCVAFDETAFCGIDEAATVDCYADDVSAEDVEDVEDTGDEDV